MNICTCNFELLDQIEPAETIIILLLMLLSVWHVAMETHVWQSVGRTSRIVLVEKLLKVITTNLLYGENQTMDVRRKKMALITCANSEDPDQPAHASSQSDQSLFWLSIFSTVFLYSRSLILSFVACKRHNGPCVAYQIYCSSEVHKGALMHSWIVRPRSACISTQFDQSPRFSPAESSASWLSLD